MCPVQGRREEECRESLEAAPSLEEAETNARGQQEVKALRRRGREAEEASQSMWWSGKQKTGEKSWRDGSAG